MGWRKLTQFYTKNQSEADEHTCTWKKLIEKFTKNQLKINEKLTQFKTDIRNGMARRSCQETIEEYFMKINKIENPRFLIITSRSHKHFENEEIENL